MQKCTGNPGRRRNLPARLASQPPYPAAVTSRATSRHGIDRTRSTAQRSTSNRSSSSSRNGWKSSATNPSPSRARLQRGAQTRRRKDLVGAAQRREVRQVVERVDQLPAEGQHDDPVAGLDLRAHRRAVLEPVLAQQPQGRLRQLAAGRPEARRAAAPSASRADTPRSSERALGGRVEVGPALVLPAVERDLVPGGVDLAQRVRVELGVEPLDEERRPQIRRGEQRRGSAAACA